MKKSLFAVFVLVSSLLMAIPSVHAMSEQDLSTKVKATYNINGNSIKISQRYINLFEDYISQFDISSEDCQYIADQIDILEKAAKAKGVTSTKDFQKKCAAEIKAACANVSAHTGIKATVLSNGRVSVSKYNMPNEVFTILRTTIATNTGSASIIVIASTITLLGAILLVRKAKKA